MILKYDFNDIIIDRVRVQTKNNNSIYFYIFIIFYGRKTKMFKKNEI